MKLSKIICHCIILIFCVCLFKSTWSQISEPDKVKKDVRSLLAQLQSAETAASAEAVKKSNLNEKMDIVKMDWDAVNEKIRIHNLHPVTYDLDKPKPADAIAYDDEKARLNTEQADILARGNKIDNEMADAQSRIDSLGYVKSNLQASIKLKSFDVLKFFNTPSCGQMPSDEASAMEWKSYLDCLFDGTRRDNPDFVEPENPTGTNFFSDPNAVVVPDYDPVAQQQKQNQIKKYLEETEKSKKPKQPIVVPSPEVNSNNQNGGSLSDKLKDVINNLKKKFSSTNQQKDPTNIAAVRD
ncbi:MAG TPA: hypothetical protein VET23_02180 [Chitinophagaceae bacterium]|nr:hypothetical protein [Chitinophagaceae bacterium]